MNNQNSFINQQYSNYEQSNNLPNSKGSKKIILIIVLIVVILGIIAFIFLKPNKSNDKIDINYSSAFFLKNDGKYALFSDSGKKLTDFVFTSVRDFSNGSSLVEKDGLYGIINDKGKMTVDFGKYEKIEFIKGMYKVTDGSKVYLIDGNGKVLYDLEKRYLKTYSSDVYSILDDNVSNKYIVLNYMGKSILTLDKIEKINDFATSESNDYVSIFYNNKNYIIDAISGSEVIEFDDSIHYCVNDVREDGRIITMNSCSYGYDTKYKFIVDGKLYDLNDQCERVYYSGGTLVCKNGNNEYLIDDKITVLVNTFDGAYIDNQNYAMNKKGNYNGVDFYNNGSINNVGCRLLSSYGYMKDEMFILKTYNSKSCGTDAGYYEYYKSNGEKVFDKSFKSATNFGDDGVAIVSEDGNNYYLMNKNGKKISKDYSKVVYYSGYYIVSVNNLKGIIDANGNVLVDILYSDINFDNGEYPILTTTDSKYVVYDLNKKTNVITFDSIPEMYDHYMKIYIGDKTLYYAYNGKKFYEK